MTDQQLELGFDWVRTAFAECEPIWVELDSLPSDKELSRRVDPNDEIIASMRKNGQDEPIKIAQIEGGSYYLVGGRRRIKAARRLGWTQIRAVVREMPLAEAEIARALDNQFRSNNRLTDLEVIRDFLGRWPDAGIKTITAYTGLKAGTVKRLLAIAKLPPEFHDAVVEGFLTETTLEEISKQPASVRPLLDKLMVERAGYQVNYLPGGMSWTRLRDGKVLAKPPSLITPEDVGDITRTVKNNNFRTLDLPGMNAKARYQSYGVLDNESRFYPAEDIMQARDAIKKGQAGIVVFVKEV